MRTLKKTLCLVLCLAMMAGLCVSAFAFDDDAEIKYKEAVAVLTGIGVIKGMDENNFAPAGELTRAQACTIIARLLKEDDVKATCTFGDCKDHWASNAIAYCAAKGIVAGFGDGNFYPEVALTGSAWAKMLLCALGYNAANEGMIGDTWEVGVGSLVKTTELAAGIKSFDGTANITREEACQLAFNALFVEEVGYKNGGTVITTGDVTITTAASAAEGNGKYLKDLFKLKDTTDSAAADEYGRDAVKQWSAGTPSKAIYTAYAAADWSYTNKTGANVGASKVKDAYCKEVGLKNTALICAFDKNVYPGETVEFSVSADGKTLTFEQAYEYYFYQVTDVAEAADDAEYALDIELTDPLYGDVIATTDEELTVAVEEDDWVAVPCWWDYTTVLEADAEPVLADAVVLEGVNGVMSAYNGTTKTATIGGKKLVLDDDFVDVDGEIAAKDFASTLTYYVAPNGMIAVVELYEESFTYETVIGYALNFQSRKYNAATTETNLLGETEGVAAKEGRAVVEMLDMDGTVTIYDLAVKQDAKNAKTTYVGKDSVLTGEVTTQPKTAINQFVKYYVNEDGTIVVVDYDAPVAVTTTKGSYVVGSNKANSKTVLHIVEAKDAQGKYATKEIVGYKNFVDATYKAYVVIDAKTGYISDIYAVDAAAAPVVIVPTLAFCKAIGDETKDGTEVTFIVDGEEVTYLQETAICAAGKYYELAVDDGVVDAATVEATPDFDDAKISAVDDGFVDTDKGVVEFLKNTKVYDISGKSLTLAKGVVIDVFALTADDMVIFIVGK